MYKDISSSFHQQNTFSQRITLVSIFYTLLQLFKKCTLKANKSHRLIPIHIEDRRSKLRTRSFLTLSSSRRRVNKAITMCTLSRRCRDQAYAVGILIIVFFFSYLNIVNATYNDCTRLTVNFDRRLGRRRRLECFWSFPSMTSVLWSISTFSLNLCTDCMFFHAPWTHDSISNISACHPEIFWDQRRVMLNVVKCTK